MYGQPQYGYGQSQQPQYGEPMYGQPVGYAQPVSHGVQNSSTNVTALKPNEASTPSTGCRDLPFAVVFIINVLVICGLAGVWGPGALKESNSSSSSSWITPKDTKIVVGIAIGLSIVAILLALLSVKLIVKYARFMITFVLWFNVAIAFVWAAYGFYIKQFLLGVLGIVIALLSFCYARMVQHRIPFAVANLKVSEAAISKHWSTYLVAILLTVVQVGWIVVWSIACLGVIEHLNSESKTTTNKPTGVGYVVYFFLLISFYWGLQVFKNVAHTTIAGTVASFWYKSESKGSTGAALKRSMTTSFGSICFGSLLVAIIQALRQLAEQGRQEGSFLACIAECLLSCLQSIVEYINRWAYVYVGIYGYKFTEAGKAVFQLFHQRGFDAIINDDLIGNVLGFAALAVGLICAGLGAIAANADLVKFSNATTFLVILGLILGIGVAMTPLSVIDSSIATIFVCFAEDPAAFLQAHPDLYHPLVTEWHNLYPDIMVQAGYWHA